MLGITWDNDCALCTDTISRYYEIILPKTKPEKEDLINTMNSLAFRVGQVYDEDIDTFYNVPKMEKSFTVQLRLKNGQTTNGVIVTVEPPPTLTYQTYGLVTGIYLNHNVSKTMMHTKFVSLGSFESLDGGSIVPSDINTIYFRFDQQKRGWLYFDDIRFTKF